MSACTILLGLCQGQVFVNQIHTWIIYLSLLDFSASIQCQVESGDKSAISALSVSRSLTPVIQGMYPDQAILFKVKARN